LFVEKEEPLGLPGENFEVVEKTKREVERGRRGKRDPVLGVACAGMERPAKLKGGKENENPQWNARIRRSKAMLGSTTITGAHKWKILVTEKLSDENENGKSEQLGVRLNGRKIPRGINRNNAQVGCKRRTGAEGGGVKVGRSPSKKLKEKRARGKRP